MVKTLMAQVKEYKKASLVTPVFMVLEVLMEILIPTLMALLIDNGVSTGNVRYVCIVGGIMVVMAVLSLVFGVLAGRYAAKASSGFARNLRKGMFENIQSFSFQNIDKYSTAGLVTRMTTDVTNLQNSYQMILRMCFRAPITMILAFVMCVRISPRLSMIFVVAIAFLAVCLYFIIGRSHSLFRQMFKKYDALNASVQENVSAIRVVKAYVREDHENRKFDRACGDVYDLSVGAEKLLVLNSPLMQFTVYTCILLISWLGAHMIVGGTLTTGELMSLFTYTMNILMSLMMVSMIFVMLAMSRASGDRVAEVLTERSNLTNPQEPVLEVKDGSIDFDHVRFSYKQEGKPIFDDLSFSIRSGQTVGILGGTGSAKSTLVQLIPRLYDVSAGSVRVGGLDVRRYDIETLRAEVAMVLQKNVLFSGTIRDNLRWGDKDASDEEIERVCRLAQADEFIQTFPDKYDTHIEQGGTNVSGGQKQRLCIARALLMKPKILILDDSTSAVDTRTDSLIREALRTELPGTTKIIIAQRIASVMDADQILVLNDGRIEDMGSHEELMRTSEIYRDVYESQMKGIEAGAAGSEAKEGGDLQ
ncbi:ABC transporter transmembrane domain-containing protein [Beduinella massiliensis]|uniref:ABC transporter transmembrane domain-containing protein n=1 Tax=Beduinella massiliensis TaxID=1852363 RepID=UPI000C858E6A